jgi:hypothetical protein
MRAPIVAVLVFATSTASARAGQYACLPAPITKVQIGSFERYPTVGTDTDSGLFHRREVTPSGACGSHVDVAPGQVAVLWFEKSHYESVVDHTAMNPHLQCAFSDGTELDFRDLPKMNVVQPYELLLRCPGANGYDCGEGGYTERNAKYEALMKEKGLVMRSFAIPTNAEMSSLEARNGKWNGRDVSCAWSDQKGAVLYSTRFRIGPEVAAVAGPLTPLVRQASGIDPEEERKAQLKAKRDPAFAHTAAELDAEIKRKTAGYARDGQAFSGTLENYREHRIVQQRGRCYMKVLKLAPGAAFSEHAKQGLWMVAVSPHNEETGSHVWGPGMVNGSYCPLRTEIGMLDLHAMSGDGERTGLTHDLGHGGYTITVYSKPISPRELAKLEAEINEQVRGDHERIRARKVFEAEQCRRWRETGNPMARTCN